ncbi:MAG TPA: hypothetical protein VNK94_13095 [Gaiellaceae bacterium]|nr:hypothetical protein [Gaiellaceae bacterium]
MTNESGPLGPLSSASSGRAKILADEVARLRSGIWAALEDLEAGDQRSACEILLNLVEDAAAPTPDRCRYVA